MRYAIEHGFRHFDFTIGDERYKLEWSDRTLVLYDHVAPASARGWAAAAMVHGHRSQALHQAERSALVAVQPGACRDRSEVCGPGR
jgi:CelD/BcsL family acetyltransferase involved in cellulose biosynthesis